MHDIASIRFRNLPAAERFAAQELNQLDGGAKLKRAGEIVAAVLATLEQSGDMPAARARAIVDSVYTFSTDESDELPPNLQDVAPDDGGPVLGSPVGRTAFPRAVRDFGKRD